MFSKNLKYYRLMKKLSKKELAEQIGISAMAITHYENNQRTPDMSTIQKLATALGVKISDFLSSRKTSCVIIHNEFRKSSSLSKQGQDFVKESAEEYYNRFATIVEILGNKVLADAPVCHTLAVSGDAEIDAGRLRSHLGFAPTGPIENLIGQLENKGFLIYLCNIADSSFSGINGSVDGRPYIMINSNVTAERMRSTIIHELAHIMFNWGNIKLPESEIEKHATAISGAFLFPKEDAIRELGIHRSGIFGDMTPIAREYGISMWMLAQRANILSIVPEYAARRFFINTSKIGWRKNEPSRIPKETCSLFRQLVFRAVSEEEISVSRGAELLKITYDEVLQHTSFNEE